MLPRVALLAVACAALAACSPPQPGPGTAGPVPERIAGPWPGPDSATRYHQSFETACHNCYEKKYVGQFATALPLVRNLELDIYARPSTLPDSLVRTWLVRHDAGDPDHANNCPRSGTIPNDLRACLEEIRSWMARRPRDLPLTVFLDLKDTEWHAGRKPADLDRLLRDIFGDRIYTPRQMRDAWDRDGTLREAAQARAWPRVDSIRGRILFVLTGGDDPVRTFLNPNEVLEEYVRKRGDRAAAFVAPGILSAAEVRYEPDGFDKESSGHVAFYNYLGGVDLTPEQLAKIPGGDDVRRRIATYLKRNEVGSERKVGEAITDAGAVGRIWWSGDSDPPALRLCRAAAAGFQRPAMFAIKRQPEAC